MKATKRRIHKAKIIAENGDVSPVCADVVPKAIDMKKDSWTLQWEAVTCRACRNRKSREAEP